MLNQAIRKLDSLVVVGHSASKQHHSKSVHMAINVRLYQEADAQVLAHLFFDSVRNGTAEFYSIEQREAWARNVPDVPGWATRLALIKTFVAENAGAIAGFMTLDNTGYIDLAFVRSDFIGKGIGSTLYEYVYDEALSLGLPLLHTQASEMAKPFFEKHGWILVKTQEITHENVELTNHKMEKRLS